jgi:acyl transferase domain-containing protein/acyl carrier protein
MLEQGENYARAIAVVGMAGRFPGAPDVRAFWTNLREGRETVTFFSPGDLAAAGIMESLYRRENYVAAKGTLDGVELFDPEFFGMSEQEATIMDPQHRIFLECAWEALEDAAYDSARFDGRIGVYGGVGMNTYLLSSVARDPVTFEMLLSDYEAFAAGNMDSLATRVAYALDLHGPAMTVQTASSTSLVAIHLACRSLLAGECDMALAGGAGVRSEQPEGYLYQKGSALSADGHCRPFDRAASGMVNGSGAGIVVLKRLSDAVTADDVIHAVVLASAVNNDGSTGKAEFTAPGLHGQAQVVMDALAATGVCAGTIGFVEAHGTGTIVGDPIEVHGLTQAFRADTDRIGYCALGSAKANVGHLDAAAGVTGFIKAVLSVRDGLITPMVNFAEPNPELDLATSPFYVPTSLVTWPGSAVPRRAGVSSFGVGGTNAHAIVEQPPPRPASGKSRSWQLIALSARSAAALEESSQRVAEVIGGLSSGPCLADASYTLQVGRREFPHRRAVVCQYPGQASAALRGADPERSFTHHYQENKPRTLAFLLPGLDSQYPGMARELYEQEPVFAGHADKCAELVTAAIGRDFHPVIRRHGDADTAQERLAALFSVEFAVAQLWISWGVRPQALLGRGGGEYAAACLAGVLSLKDAVATVLSLPTAQVGSSLSGMWLTSEQATDADYWVRHLRNPARFVDALRLACSEPDAVFLEIGPGRSLGALAREQYRASEAGQSAVVSSSLPAAEDNKSDTETIMTAVGQLWVTGVPIDWERMWAGERRARISLPTYPFQRQRYSLRRLASPPHAAQAPRAGGASTVAVPDAVPVRGRPGSLPSEYVAPRTELEETIAAIWGKLMGYQSIGVFDDFFLLGGDSLSAAQVAGRLRDSFSVAISVKEAFDLRTIEAQARAVEELLIERLALISDDEAEALLAEMNVSDEEHGN